MGKPYSDELDRFADTFRWAGAQNVAQLGRYLQRWGGEYLAIVGSGGSYSAALVVAMFREIAFGSPSVAMTPLEFVSALDRLAPHVLLLSAEGKNKDILAAARRAAAADLASAAVTLTEHNPLAAYGNESRAARIFAFQMDWVKDGYLATNSLLATVLLLYRAFFGKDCFSGPIAELFEARRLQDRRRQVRSLCASLTKAAPRNAPRNVLLLYSAAAQSFAVDVESKLSEAALAHVQITDFRQFAHGRHLQLSRATAPDVICAFSASERELALRTQELLPRHVNVVMLEIGGDTPQDIAIGGLLDAMFLTEAIGLAATVDPGDPDVPEYGRAIHRLDPDALLKPAPPISSVELAIRRKSGGTVVSPAGSPDGAAHRAALDYLDRVTSSSIKAIVCDFDGTLCRTEDRFEDMAPEMAALISELIRNGCAVAIASGRGDSLHSSLRRSFSPELHASITVGYYSGGFISTLDLPFTHPAPDYRFEGLYWWLLKSAYPDLSQPLHELARGGQFSLRIADSCRAVQLSNAIKHWIGQNAQQGWRVFCSGHSIDVLDSGTSKRAVVERVAADARADVFKEILRLGDCGREDGNDFELLNQGLGLSSDSVSFDLASCWNFSPPGCNQSEATMHYLSSLNHEDGVLRMSRAALLDATNRSRPQ